jgi:hypothetical protein
LFDKLDTRDAERHTKLKHGGARRDRTDDLLLAKQALSQLSYGPVGLCPFARRPKVEDEQTKGGSRTATNVK